MFSNSRLWAILSLRFALRLSAGLVMICAVAPLWADDFPAPKNTQAETTKLLSPQEALATIKVPDGFAVSLFAAEPDVQQPISLTTDERGRLWVAECYTYAENAVNFAGGQRDRVVILEDADGDGRAERRKVFWDQGRKLTSVEVGFGGVWVLCAPKLLFIPDKDRNDVPDGPPQTVLDGFDDFAVRHNIVNGLKWGPDGWLYGRHGILATSLVGKPGASESQRQKINCGIWRYHPTRGAFEVVAHGTTNPWGFDYDPQGELFFINTVIGHLWHLVPGAHYERMYGTHFNPHLYALMDQTADHVHWDTGEAWSDVRKGVSATTDKAGGGHAHSGLMIYQGDNWPAEYRGRVFTVNLHGRRLNQDLLVRQEHGYTAKHGEDFFFVGDPWFRGIDLVYGPDGGVYVADWSDTGECHENDGVHRTSGRIYKITYGHVRPTPPRDLAKASDAELVSLQLHANEWYCRQARRVLQERAAAQRDLSGAAAALREIVEKHPEPTRKLRALWCLYAIHAVPPQWLVEQLRHPEEGMRVWAVRLLREHMAPDVAPPPAMLTALRQAAADEKSGLVRLHLASLLTQLPFEHRLALASELAGRPAASDGRNLALLIWYGIEPVVPRNPEGALSFAELNKLPLLARHVARRITSNLDAAPNDVESLVRCLAERCDEAQAMEMLGGMRDALRGWQRAAPPKSWKAAAEKLSASNQEALRELVREVSVVFGDGRALDDLRTIAATDSADPQARRQALRTLIQARPPDLAALLHKLAADRAVTMDAIRGLAAYDDPKTSEILLAQYARMSPEDRAEAIATLCSRPPYALALLQAVERGQIARTDITAFHARQINSLRRPELDSLLSKVWGEIRTSSAEKQQLLARYKQALTAERLQEADLSQGRVLFNQTCAACHVLYGQGKKVGPDLTGGNRRHLDYLLENIVDPSASVAADFRMSVIQLDDGRVVNGVVVETTDRTLTVQTQKETVVLDRKTIEKMEPTPLSLMPEGILTPLSEQQVRDLVAYLMSSEQAPLPAAGK